MPPAATEFPSASVASARRRFNDPEPQDNPRVGSQVAARWRRGGDTVGERRTIVPSSVGRHRVVLGVFAATAVIVVSSLRTEAGNEALDFWLQNWGGERSHERAATAPENPQLKITVTPRHSDREHGGGDRESGGTYCVRTCDGYYFPLSAQRRSNSESRELCNSLCPGAETEVYHRRGGPDASFTQAVSYK